MNLTEKDNHSEKITALYCRVALRETASDESKGIRQQKILLEQYAREQDFSNIQFYIDDGYSGLNFTTRPALNRLCGDINTGKVGIVIVNDNARLGRDPIKTSQLISEFSKAGIHFISLINCDAKIGEEPFTTLQQFVENFKVYPRVNRWN